MNRLKWTLLILLLIAGGVYAQRRGGFGGGGRGFMGGGRSDLYDTPREMPQHSTDDNGELLTTPTWTNTPGFDKDTFTFVRIKRSGGGGPSWSTDAPDSDLNIAWRLSTLTALKVNPDGRFLSLTDKELNSYPFIYMVEPGGLYLDQTEADALRKYLLNGGFLWLDDFWGEYEWSNMAAELKKAFPERDWQELPLDHQLYHCVFNIKSKEQIPGIDYWRRSGGETAERADAREVHHRVLLDDKGRIMALATHNTDNGDGWEREGENHVYFQQFAEKTAYPLAINVLFYTMTH